MQVREFPRVLSVDAAAMSLDSDMAILKTHLFSAWPRSEVAQVVIGNATITDACATNWRITGKDLRASRAGRCVEPSDVQDDTGSNPAARRGTLRCRIRAFARPLLYAWSDASTSRAEVAAFRPLCRWIEEFRPDVLFTFGGSITICKAAASLSERYGIPIVPFLTDDWISWLYAARPFRWVLRGKIDRWFERVLELAPLRITISELMAIEYRKRFGGDFRPCMDSVDLDRYPRASVYKRRAAGETVTFSYIGVMAPNRWQILRALAEQVQALRDNGANCCLRIYTLPEEARLYASKLHFSDEVGIAGSLRYADVAAAQVASDVLVHVESFATGLDGARTRLSMSTKIPQYLAAGRPILAIGPGDRASVQYLANSGAAVIVARQDPQLIRNAVSTLVEDAEYRVRLGQTGRAVCERNHTRQAMNRLFADCVREAATASVEAKRRPNG